MYQARYCPLSATRIEDLGPGDFVKVDCAACLAIGLRRISAPNAAPFHRRRRVCARRADPPSVAPIRRSTRSARLRPMSLRRATTPFVSAPGLPRLRRPPKLYTRSSTQVRSPFGEGLSKSTRRPARIASATFEMRAILRVRSARDGI
jgi:hypothetical protein